MKKILLLLLLATFSIQAQTLQNPTYGNVKLKNNTTDNSATKVNVQSTDGTINTISKSDLVNVVEVNDVPSLPLVGEVGKIYVVKNVNKIYRWNGTFYQKLAGSDISGKEDIANKQNSLDADGTGTKYPTVDAVFDALATKADDSNVVHLSVNETITGEKTIKNKLFFRNAANGLFLTIPELSTNFSAENTVLGVGAGSAIVPIQFNSPTYGLITGGTANTIFGQHAGNTLNAGNENTLIGHNAGYSLFLPVGNDPNFDSSLNTFIGSTAGYNVTFGYANTFIGQKAGVNVTESGHNVIIGKSAGGDGSHLNAIKDANVIIGSGAAKEATFIRRSVILGAEAGYDSDITDSIILGNNSGSGGLSISNSFVAGSSPWPINNVYFGKGYKSASPTSYTIHGTGGVGSEITGGNLVLAGGTGTGNANGGDVVIRTSDIVTAGTQAHYLSDAVTIKSISQNVGVGTSSPSEKLEVNGNIKSTSFIKSGGTSSEFLKADGSVSSYTNLISGTGTANLVAKWATSATQSKSIIQDDGTTVGVGTGTLSAGQKLQVFGNSSLTGSLSINNDGAVVSGFNSAGSTQSGFLTFNAFNGVSLASSNTNPVKFSVNGTENGRFFAGNLMVGTTTNSGERLQIAGTAKITGLTTLTVSPIITSETANTIASFDATKNVKSLSLSTYPSLSELAYVKGATSSIQTQINAKADINSPTFTGTPTAPTATAGANTTQVATTAFVTNGIATADAGNVKLTGDQTISGQKSFSLTGKIDMQTNNAFPAIRVTALGSNGEIAAEFINNSSSPYSTALNLQTGLSGGVGNVTLDVWNQSPIGTGIVSNASNGGVSISSQSGNGDSYISNITSGGTGRNYVGRNNGIETYSVDKIGNVTATQYKISALNTAPASATATGTLGEIRITAGFIYVCTATNTWVRTALATW